MSDYDNRVWAKVAKNCNYAPILHIEMLYLCQETCHDSPVAPSHIAEGLARRHSPWTTDRCRKKNRQAQDDLPDCISEDEDDIDEGNRCMFPVFSICFASR